MIKVSDIKVTKFDIKLKDGLEHLIPTTNIPHHIEFVLSGVSNAVSNAIRRTVLCELPVYHLECEYENIKTNDAHIIPEMLQKRLMMIPINQTASGKFELEAMNSDVLPLDVKTSEFKYNGKSKDLPFNGTITFVTLNPGKFIKISDIVIKRNYGYQTGYGMLSLGMNAASIALDQEPLNMYEGTGIPSREADPRVWKISFNTNGTMPPHEVVKFACDNIISRLNNVIDMLYSIESNDDQYILSLHGESHTIGNLLMKTINELYPGIIAVVYNVVSVERLMILRVRSDDEIKPIITAVVKYLINTFTEIKSAF